MKNLYNLAQQGINFQNAYTNGGWTQAAFPALLSSTYPSMYNGCLGPLAEQRPYLPQILQQHGYHTLAVQTSPLLEQKFGYGRGMDELIGLDPPWHAPSWYRIRGMQRLLRRSAFHSLTRVANIQSKPAPAYANAREATDQALRLLQLVEEPFFLWIHYMDAHWPYFDQEEDSDPAALARTWRDRQLAHVAVRQKNRQEPPSETVERWVAMYDAALENVDHEAGRLLETASADHDDICIIVTGDHGEEFFEHGNFGHGAGSLYEEIIHVPLILVNSKRFAATTIDQPVSLLDVPPTISEVTDSEAPATMMGKSLLPLVSEKPAGLEKRPLVSESHWGDDVHLVAIRSGIYKYIIDLREPQQWQLFNLIKDPDEKYDLHHSDRLDVPDFKGLLDKHLAAVRASKIDQTTIAPTDDRLTNRLRDLGYLD